MSLCKILQTCYGIISNYIEPGFTKPACHSYPEKTVEELKHFYFIFGVHTCSATYLTA
jgi:hypothetical protein